MTFQPFVQLMLQWSAERPWLFATLVISIMVAEGLLLGLITDWLFVALGSRVRGLNRHSSRR